MEIMENKACLDSDFLIDFLKNGKDEINWIKENKETEMATTIINVLELYYGEYKNNAKSNVGNLENFLKNFSVLNLNEEIAKKAGKIAAGLEKEGNVLEFRDVLIAAIASHHGYPIKTGNKKHFGRIKDLKLI